mgnify:CR=1 FL=1
MDKLVGTVRCWVGCTSLRTTDPDRDTSSPRQDVVVGDKSRRRAADTATPTWLTGSGPSAAAQADFIIPNMVAEAASGSKTPKEAAERAQKRAERYYKL